jgi:hypothetical protein
MVNKIKYNGRIYLPNDLIFIGHFKLSTIPAHQLKNGDFILVRERTGKFWEGTYDTVDGRDQWAIESEIEDGNIADLKLYRVQIFNISYFGGYYTLKCEKGVEISVCRIEDVITCDVTCLPSKKIVAIAKALSEIKP